MQDKEFRANGRSGKILRRVVSSSEEIFLKLAVVTHLEGFAVAYCQ